MVITIEYKAYRLRHPVSQVACDSTRSGSAKLVRSNCVGHAESRQVGGSGTCNTRGRVFDNQALFVSKRQMVLSHTDSIDLAKTYPVTFRIGFAITDVLSTDDGREKPA